MQRYHLLYCSLVEYVIKICIMKHICCKCFAHLEEERRGEEGRKGEEILEETHIIFLRIPAVFGATFTMTEEAIPTQIAALSGGNPFYFPPCMQQQHCSEIWKSPPIISGDDTGMT